MANQPEADSPAPDSCAAPSITLTAAEAAEKQRKKKAKVRSAWISFVGRIVAQFVGASATFVLALMLLQSQQRASVGPTGGQPAVATAPADTLPSPHRIRRAEDSVPLAVLPLANYSGDSRNDALASAITEALIAALSKEHGLAVVSRTTSVYYGQRFEPLTELARRMDVDWVVEGALVRAGGRLRVIIQLIDAPADEHAWASTYDRMASDALSMQSSLAPPIARDIAEVLALRRNGAVRTELHRPPAPGAPVPGAVIRP